MGYHVQLTSGELTINKENLDKAYKAMCDLNTTHHSQKRGGSFSGGTKNQSWFSWMDANYPDTCKDADAILQALGFETYSDNDGNLIINGYESKTGQEDLFLNAIAPYTTGHIEWRGECGAMWCHDFINGKMITKQGKVIWE